MKQFAKFCTVLMVLCMVFGLCTTAYAAGSVTYDGNANKFIFAPGTEASPTSLFENFQDVMPGDSVTEQILIKNDESNSVKIKVYMRSLGAQEETEKFLSQLKLSVEQAGASLLFDASADQTAQLTDWVYLGTVFSGGEITLNVTLEVPVTMGNDYQNKIGYIDWQFKIEELPVETSDPKPPQTGDPTDLLPIALLMGASFLALIALLVLGGRKRHSRK